MPAFLVLLGGVLSKVLQSVVGRVLVLLGLSVATYTGVGVAVDQLKQQFVSSYQSMPAVMLDLLGLLKIDQGMLIIFSALAGRVAFVAVNGAVSRLIQGRPGA
jgi:hypothetical protein